MTISEKNGFQFPTRSPGWWFVEVNTWVISMVNNGWWWLIVVNYLLGALEHVYGFPYLGNVMSSQLTKSILFQRGIRIPGSTTKQMESLIQAGISLPGVQDDFMEQRDLMVNGFFHFMGSDLIVFDWPSYWNPIWCAIEFNIWTLPTCWFSFCFDAVSGDLVVSFFRASGHWLMTIIVLNLIGGFKHFFHDIWDNPSHWLL